MKYIQKFLLSLALLCTHNPSVFASTLHKLVKKNEIEKVKDFLDKNKELINTQNSNGKTPLYRACSKNLIKITKLLLKNGANPNIANKFKETPLYTACSKNYKEIIRLLLENGANPNILNGSGETLLYWACTCDKFDIVKLLLEKGANPNILNKDGMTPLYWPCLCGQLDIIKLLFKKGANPNLAGKDGKTPLYRVCSKSYLDIVKLLIDKGADVNIKAKNGKSPLNLICWKWTRNRRKNLLKAPINIEQALPQNAKIFIKQVIATLEKEMQKNPTVAPKVPQNDDLLKSPLIKNPEQEIARIEEFIKIWLFEPRQKIYTWPNETTCLNKFDMICPTHFKHSPAEFRLKINFGINYKQHLFLRTLQDRAHEAIKQPKTNRYSKLIDIMIKCYKPSSTESSVSFEDITDQNIKKK